MAGTLHKQPLAERVKDRLRSIFRSAPLPSPIAEGIERKEGQFESVLGDETPGSFQPSRVAALSPQLPPWYRGDEDLSALLKPEIKQFYEEYAGIPVSDLENCLRHVRNRAWPLGHWPAFGLFSFAQDIFRSHPTYSDIVSSLKDGAVLMDVGTGLGQDLRYLAHSGAPTENMIAVDSRLDLWKLGLSLFGDGTAPGSNALDGCDRAKASRRSDFRARFIEANLLSKSFRERYRSLYGTVDIIVANNFFNNANGWLESKMAIDVLEFFTKPGTLFVGYHIAPEMTFDFMTEDNVYYHNETSLGDDTFVNGRLGWCSKGIRWEMQLYETVDLKHWGLNEDEHLAWLKEDMASHEPTSYKWHGVYYVFKRTS